MLWREVKCNAMTFIAQEFLTGEPCLEDAVPAFLTKVNVDVTVLCNQSNHAFG